MMDMYFWSNSFLSIFSSCICCVLLLISANVVSISCCFYWTSLLRSRVIVILISSNALEMLEEFWIVVAFFTSLRSETTSASNAYLSRFLSSNFFWSNSSMHLCYSTSILRPWTCSSRVLERIFSALSCFISLIASLENYSMVNPSSSL